MWLRWVEHLPSKYEFKSPVLGKMKVRGLIVLFGEFVMCDKETAL
jgi:hypothetical protein